MGCTQGHTGILSIIKSESRETFVMPEDALGTQRSNFCHLVNLDVFTIQGFEEIVLFTLARGLVGFCCFSYLVMLTHFPLEKCPLHRPPPPNQLCLYCTICSRESRSLGSGHSTQRSSRSPLCTCSFTDGAQMETWLLPSKDVQQRPPSLQAEQERQGRWVRGEDR